MDIATKQGKLEETKGNQSGPMMESATAKVRGTEGASESDAILRLRLTDLDLLITATAME